MPRVRKLAAGLFLSLLFAVGSLPVAAKPSVSSLRIGENGDTTRFVIESNQEIDFGIFALANPYRIVVDFADSDWSRVGSGSGPGRALVQRYRYGQFKPGTIRLVLDLDGPAMVDRSFVLKPQGRFPYRTVLDLKGTSRRAFLDARKNGRVRIAATTQPVPEVRSGPKAAKSQYLIMIDPGHGGVDPGASGVNGTNEKTVTLQMSRAIRDALQRTGRYKVQMTRNSDVFIRLGERVNIARRAEADLFISVHADSIGNPRVRGATVYTLSETASDAEAAALAAKENKADLIAGIDLEQQEDEVANILIELAQRESMNYSAQFATLLVPELGSRVRLRTNPHRFAGFVVLTAPDVPSVLLEMGYLSNQTDSRFLVSADGRKRISGAMVVAVNRYFNQLEARRLQ
ncbi:MAG: N-acetylmuramoyl-L-alanine amidase [Sphingomonadales bacterium]|nr:N-acetylmuramoyl-L-alanine amidase [Sphingomonadales bacterium]